jgi:hypothetical protein
VTRSASLPVPVVMNNDRMVAYAGGCNRPIFTDCTESALDSKPSDRPCRLGGGRELRQLRGVALELPDISAFIISEGEVDQPGEAAALAVDAGGKVPKLYLAQCRLNTGTCCEALVLIPQAGRISQCESPEPTRWPNHRGKR